MKGRGQLEERKKGIKVAIKGARVLMGKRTKERGKEKLILKFNRWQITPKTEVAGTRGGGAQGK